jgi:hypothetical protein
MSVKKTVKQLKEEAIAIAQSRAIDTDSDDYRAGYVKGVRSMAQIIQLARHATDVMALQSKDDPLLYRVLNGYSDTLNILLETAEDIIPPEYEMGD